MPIGTTSIRDVLYGVIDLGGEMRSLLSSPVVQRLRHVRLSNIDSIDMPGMANISRYEHVIGTSYLASQIGCWSSLGRRNQVILQASALLHDCAITSYGHLVEEAFQYVGKEFHHEELLQEILSGRKPDEIGGLQKQVLVGRETGLRPWAIKIAGSQREGDGYIAEITEHIRGTGRLGSLVASDIDLDNIDSVYRMAVHMGLDCDQAVPVRLANAIVAVDARSGLPVFRRDAAPGIDAWRGVRWAVYDHLMLAPGDFAGKVMMLYATVSAFEVGDISDVDWNMTDYGFLGRLLNSKSKDARESVSRWVAGELWDMAPLHWMAGERPDYASVLDFSRRLSEELGRSCFAYAIKDKRDRHLTIQFDDGTSREFGMDRPQWLLGFGSPVRRAFTTAEIAIAYKLAAGVLATEVLRPASPPMSDEAQAWLF